MTARKEDAMSSVMPAQAQANQLMFRRGLTDFIVRVEVWDLNDIPSVETHKARALTQDAALDMVAEKLSRRKPAPYSVDLVSCEVAR